jgi:hypothetical protein
MGLTEQPPWSGQTTFAVSQLDAFRAWLSRNFLRRPRPVQAFDNQTTYSSGDNYAGARGGQTFDNRLAPLVTSARSG